MKETDLLDEYILNHIDPEGTYLKALYRATHVHLLRPRMASGHLQGRMLKMFVKMIRPKQVLEIGTYSGYSALCLAEGLPEGSMLHTFEINDEQEDFTRPWLEGSDYADKIRFYIGDALKLLPEMDIVFDLAFIDGDVLDRVLLSHRPEYKSKHHQGEDLHAEQDDALRRIRFLLTGLASPAAGGCASAVSGSSAGGGRSPAAR